MSCSVVGVCLFPGHAPPPQAGLISPSLASLEVAGLGFAGTWDGPAGSEGGPAGPSISQGAVQPGCWLSSRGSGLCCFCPLCGLL